MACNLVLSSSAVVEYRGGMITTAPLHSVIESRVVVVKTVADAIAARDEYAREVAATGKASCVIAYKHSRCTGRKPAGFDDAMRRPVYLNLPCEV